MKLKILQLLLITHLFLILSIGNVLAIPGQPHAFYGTVTWNGKPAPDGTSVIAKINGVKVAETTTLNGEYRKSQILIVEDPYNVRSGDIIHFFVNGIDTGQTYSFCNGCTTRLDLTAVGSEEQEEERQDGSTRESEITTITIISEGTTTTICQERWTCTAWSPCSNGMQTRTCTEGNNCGTDLYKPFESQPCGTEETKGQAFPITGLIVLTQSQAISLITVVLIVVIFFGWRRVFRKKTISTTPSMNELSIEAL